MQRLRATARNAADELKIRLLGRDFEQRVSVLKERYVDMGGDPFGFDVATARNAAMVIAFFHRMYFRTEVFGIQHVPPGRVLLVANHSGQVPIDAAIVGSSLFFDANPPRVVRAMVEKWTATLPFVSAFFNRVGQVVGVPENARRLLEMGRGAVGFPGGHPRRLEAVRAALSARAVWARLHAPRDRDEHADRARGGDWRGGAVRQFGGT